MPSRLGSEMKMASVRPLRMSSRNGSSGRMADLTRRPPIRVAFVVDTMHFGGTEMNALRTAKRLDPARFSVVVATLARRGPLLQEYQDTGIRVVQFPISSLYNRTALTEGMRLFRFLRSERIDVLHCHDLYANAFAVPWGRIARVPVVIASRRWTHPVASRPMEFVNRVAYRLAHRILGNSGAVARMLRDIDGVPAERILEVPNFVESHAFQSPTLASQAAFRTELGIPAGALVVGCVARLVDVKDHRTMLRAMALLAPSWPTLRLVLVGDGPLRSPLESLANELGIVGQVHFAGHRANDPNINRMFDISALCSLSEGFPNVIVEAMAAERPVVATAVGGNVDAVRGGTGILVPPAEPAHLANALDRLLRDPVLRRRMGAEGGRVARAEYHVSTVIPRLEAMYCDLLDRFAASPK